MKLWRKMATKGNGRSIKYSMAMQEAMMRGTARTYPLLEALFKRAGMSYSLSNRQQDVLKNMIDESKAKEATDAAV